MQKRVINMKRALLLSCVLLVAALCGCGQGGEPTKEADGSGYFRDVDLGMTIEEVIAAEEGREDSGEPERYEQYSALMYDEITWDGYTCNLSYIFNTDGVHLDTILVEILSGVDFERTKQTLVDLYTDGTAPEQSDGEYFAWSTEEQVVLAQNNADGSAVIVLMLVPEEVPAEEPAVEETPAQETPAQ